MKKTIFSIITFIVPYFSFSQSIGINTIPSNTEVAKVVIDSPTPGNGSVKFQTTTTAPIAQQVLVSDANGNAVWQNYNLDASAIYQNVLVNYTPTPFTLSGTSNSGGGFITPATYTGASFDLPEGIWAIYISMKATATSGTTTTQPLVTGQGLWIRLLIDNKSTNYTSPYFRMRQLSISETNTNLYDNNNNGTFDPPYLISGNIVGPNSSGLLNGEIYLINCDYKYKLAGTTGTEVTVNKKNTFYIKLNVESYGGNTPNTQFNVSGVGSPPSFSGENRIVPIFAGKCPVN
ncbi:hypothetical protein [Chryseobacterium oryzae]|uniref:Uncharacterized protein n=1 Tax=Chryseobacterium oryzae TaxID=2929799 RepID=A0ABY4BNJ9_9FLAO|nr:hypothetical protein [Chryseobacterium oryzae]UOE39361.1 hypothetical protein MTP08_06195 [Chryseobacterium oryzae]